MFTKIKKFWLCLLLIAGLSANVYAESFTTSKVKNLLENQFSAILNKKVEIGELSGNLYKQVNLKDVKIYENNLTKEIFFYAEKIEIFYSLKKFIINPKNILENITLVNVDKPWFKVNRDQQGEFNNFNNQRNLSNNNNFSEKIKLTIRINQGKGYYSDQRGWGEVPIDKPFIKELNQLNGTVQIKDRRLLFQLTANLPVEKKYSQINLQGEQKDTLFRMSMEVADLDVKEWSRYSAPLPDIYIAHSGISDLKINLQKLNNDLDYKIILNLKNVVLDLPLILKKRLFQTSGQLTVGNNFLEFKNSKALLDNKIPLTLNGKLVNFERPRINLLLTAKSLPIDHLSQYLKDSSDLPVKGKVSANLTLTGMADSPRIQGTFDSSQVEIFNLEIKSVNGKINLYKNDLWLNIIDSRLLSGEAVLSGNINIQESNNPYLDLKVHLKDGEVKNLNFDNFRGNFSGKLKAKGYLNNLHLSANSTTANLAVFEQQVTNFKIKANKLNDTFIFENCLISNNDLPVTINGQIKNYQFFNFDILSNKFYYNNKPFGNSALTIAGKITANLNGDFQQINNLATSGNLIIDQANILGENNINGNIIFSSKADKLNLKKCILKKEENLLILDGIFSNQIFDLNIRKNSILKPSSLSLLKKSIPGLDVNSSVEILGNIKKNPQLSLWIDFETKEQLINKDFQFENIQGTIALENETLHFKNIKLKSNQEQYLLSGYLPAKKKLSTKDNILLNIDCTDAQIKSIYQFYKTITETLSLSQLSQQPLSKVNYSVSFDNCSELYLKNSTDGILNKYHLHKSAIETIELFNQALLPEGTINGKLSFNWSDQSLLINSDLEINDFSHGAIQAKNILLNFETNNDIVNIRTKIRNLSNLYNNFPKTEVSAKFENGYLVINNFDIFVDEIKYQNIIKGKFPLSAYWDSQAISKDIDLSINLPQNSIAILSLLTGIKKIKHQGNLFLRIGGNFQKPLINKGYFNIDKLKIEFPRIKEMLQIESGKISIADNFINIQQIHSSFLEPKKNYLSFVTNGTALLKELSLENVQSNKFFIDLQNKNTEGNINISNLYQGKIDLQNFSLKGDYSSLTTNIKLSGDIILEEGVFYLPNNETQSNSNLLLDLNIKFNNNVAVRQGKNLISGDLSKIIGEINIFIDPKSSQMKIAGPLSNLKFDGTINFSDGIIKFLNRDFYFINKDVQQPYLKDYPEKIRQNELVMNSALEEQFSFHLRSETIIFEEVLTTQNTTEVTENKTTNKISTEKRFVFLIDGPLNKLSSFTFIGYEIKNNTLNKVGTPYYLVDPQNNQLLSDIRFQQLVYELAPSFLKNPSQDTGKQLARDIFYSEINQYFKTLIRPYERMLAKQTGLYDVRVKGDFAQQTAKLFQTENTTETYHNKLALELVYELYKEKLFFTLDTSPGQLNYYKITWHILTQKYIDELSANFGNKYDYYQKDYTPMFSLEINDVF